MRTFLQLTAIVLTVMVVRGEQFRECAQPERLNTFVASQSSCARYIFCDGENSFEGECLDDNYFNEMEGNCDDRKAVECSIGGVGPITGGGTEVEVGRNESATAEVTTNLNSLIQQTGDDFSGYPEQEFLLANSATPQCPLMFGLSNLLHLPNPDSCSAYYTCYNGIAIPMLCARQLYFNVDSGRCERQEGVHCPQLNRPVRLYCRKGVYDFIPHRNCEYYYFCSNGFLMIFHCPVQFSWHYERRMCVHHSQAKCFANSMIQDMLFG